jgi:hypothetical protein
MKPGARTFAFIHQQARGSLPSVKREALSLRAAALLGSRKARARSNIEDLTELLIRSLRALQRRRRKPPARRLLSPDAARRTIPALSSAHLGKLAHGSRPGGATTFGRDCEQRRTGHRAVRSPIRAMKHKPSVSSSLKDRVLIKFKYSLKAPPILMGWGIAHRSQWFGGDRRTRRCAFRRLCIA